MPAKKALKDYEKKRELNKTPEPSGKSKPKKRKKKGQIFVVQQHAASTLHYDFRIEDEGVLKSWAVPKGPSMNPDDKRLAIMVEDHPLDYAGFEGNIPEGNYGAGTVIVWDTGTYRNIMGEKDEPLTVSESLEKGHVEIWLEGEKLRGGFVLVRTKMGGKDNHWLLKKMKDEMAVSKDILRSKTKSVISGKTLKQMMKIGVL